MRKRQATASWNDITHAPPTKPAKEPVNAMRILRAMATTPAMKTAVAGVAASAIQSVMLRHAQKRKQQEEEEQVEKGTKSASSELLHDQAC